MLQLSTESSVPSIQNNKQYHIELTREFVCLTFFKKSSETCSVLAGLQKYKEPYLSKSASLQKKPNQTKTQKVEVFYGKHPYFLFPLMLEIKDCKHPHN